MLYRPAEANALEMILFRETSTLVVRRQPVERRCQERTSATVDTPYSPVWVKVARLPDGSSKHTPEYGDCRQATQSQGVPLRVVYEAALGLSFNLKE